MLKICLVFCKSEPQYAYKRYAHKKHVSDIRSMLSMCTTKIERKYLIIYLNVGMKYWGSQNWKYLSKHDFWSMVICWPKL